MKNLIELDEYLDLTELDIINSEFIDTIDKVPTEYTEMFTANIVQDNNITYSDGVNVLFLSDLPSDISFKILFPSSFYKWAIHKFCLEIAHTYAGQI